MTENTIILTNQRQGFNNGGFWGFRLKHNAVYVNSFVVDSCKYE